MDDKSMDDNSMDDNSAVPAGMTQERYECTTEGHNKYWIITFPFSNTAPSWYETQWGRIGTAGQRKRIKCALTRDARNTARDLIQEKVAKGYKLKLSDAVVHKIAQTPFGQKILNAQKIQTAPPPPTAGQLPAPKPLLMLGQPEVFTKADKHSKHDAIKALIDAGMSNDQISAALSVSHQTITQLRADSAKATKHKPVHVPTTKPKRKFNLDD